MLKVPCGLSVLNVSARNKWGEEESKLFLTPMVI